MRNFSLKYLLLAALVLTMSVNLTAQVGNNLILLSNWDNNNLPVISSLVYNEVFGWADGAGREYAILGSLQRTYFIEVTNPNAPVVRDSVEGTHQSCIHRDFKTYGHYCYGVADEGNSTLQIIDMSYLPDSVHVVYNSSQYFQRAHDIFIDTLSGRLYAVGTNTQYSGVIILDIATNPEVPALLANVSLNSYTHDLSVRHDTAYMNNGFDGLRVVDFSNPSAPNLIGALPSYPQQGYNHSCWLSEDGQYLAMCDETRNTSCKMVDVRSVNNLGISSLFRSALLGPADTSSIPHNPLITGQYVCVAYYHDGVQIWDIANPAAPQHVAGYDTWPNNTNYNDWYGAWGCYPFLPSGTVLVSDVNNGLFVFRVPFAFPRPITAQISSVGTTCSYTSNGSATVTPNGGTQPYSFLWSSGHTTPSITGMASGVYTVTISDRYGYNIVETLTIPGPSQLSANPQVAAESCPGTADGEIDLNVTGGTPVFSYVWSTGDMIQNINGLTAGTYIVTITDGNGCQLIDTIGLSTIFNAPVAIAGNDTLLCSNNLLLQAQSPSQGTGHWEWVAGNGQLQNPNLATTNATAVQQGWNSVAWVVFNGQCAASDTMRIYVSSTAYVNAGPDTIACSAAVQLQASSLGNATGLWSALPNTVTFSNPNQPSTQASGLQSGIYTLIWSITEGNCFAQDSLILEVGHQPFAAFSFVVAGLATSFTNVSQFGTSWLWDFGDGNTSTLQQPNHTYAMDGNYNVCLRVSDICGSDSTCQTVNISLVGLEESLAAPLQVWPNPTATSFDFRLRGNYGELEYALLDLQGKQILRGIYSPESIQRIDLSQIPSGLYFLSLRGQDFRSLTKISKR